MSVPDRTGVPEKTSQSEQYVLNYSFDEVFKLLMVGLTGYNAATNGYDRIQIDSNGGIKTTQAATTDRYDIQSPIYYLGQAPAGSAETDPVWTVTKVDMTTNPYTSKIASQTTWSGRTGATYA